MSTEEARVVTLYLVLDSEVEADLDTCTPRVSTKCKAIAKCVWKESTRRWSFPRLQLTSVVRAFLGDPGVVLVARYPLHLPTILVSDEPDLPPHLEKSHHSVCIKPGNGEQHFYVFAEYHERIKEICKNMPQAFWAPQVQLGPERYQKGAWKLLKVSLEAFIYRLNKCSNHQFVVTVQVYGSNWAVALPHEEAAARVQMLLRVAELDEGWDYNEILQAMDSTLEPTERARAAVKPEPREEDGAFSPLTLAKEERGGVAPSHIRNSGAAAAAAMPGSSELHAESRGPCATPGRAGAVPHNCSLCTSCASFVEACVARKDQCFICGDCLR